MNTPFFSITGDLNWASEYCIQDFTDLLKEYGIKPTLFASHDSHAVKDLRKSNTVEVGIQPNFLPTGTEVKKDSVIIDNLLTVYPDVQTFRSYSFYDNSDILSEMKARGINYDSNLSLYLQPDIVPLNLGTGGVRFPVFWEDDVHCSRPGSSWNFNDYRGHFSTPGLKILNFHPFFIAANIPSQEYYEKIKKHIPTVTAANIEEIRFKGKGARTFLIELLKDLSSQKFYTIGELIKLFPIRDFLFKEDETEGRHSIHSDEDYKKYWNTDEKGRQEFLKQSYQTRNPEDIYATSRDFHVRELEIESIKRQLTSPGTVLDLGCGNGYTLISLASHHAGYTMTGVDFSDNLIKGANQIRDKRKSELKSIPEFLTADAIEFLKNAKDNSYDYVITERFIQNLPSENTQKEVIKDIYRVIKPAGKLLMCEASEKGFNELNNIRGKVGLEIIEATSKENISAIRIKDSEFEKFASDQVGFKLAGKYGFSDYFLMARVFHPLFVKPQSPRFESRINEIARMIQEKSPFNAGFGSNVLWVLQKGNK